MQQCSNIVEKLRKLHPAEVPFKAESFTPLSKLLGSGEISHLMEYLCLSVQSILCLRMEEIEYGARFTVHDYFKANKSGGGITCVIENGFVFEKAVVSVFANTMPLTEALRKQIWTDDKDLSSYSLFKTIAVSSVIHPKNPHAPTLHFTFRYCEMDSKHVWNEKISWFSGSTEITPYVLHEEDVVFFHKSLKETCDMFDVTYYPKFKKLADEHYYMPHRREHTGMGGILFNELTGDPRHLLDFVTECITTGTTSLLATEVEIDWMHIRRGRGTKFALQMSGAKIESFLVTLPSSARWSYCHEPVTGSPEETLMRLLRNPVDWV